MKYKLNPKIALAEVTNAHHGVISIQGPSENSGVTPAKFDLAMKEFNESGGVLGMSNNLHNTYSITAYSSIYGRVSSKLKSIIKAVDDMRSFYLFEVITSQLAEDALSPKIGDDEIVRFGSENPTIQKELLELKKRIGLDQLIENIVPDLIAYGEYTLKTRIGTEQEYEDEINSRASRGPKKKFKKAGKGIIDVTDVVDQGTVVSIMQDGKTEGYLRLNDATDRIELCEVADYIKFALGGQRVKLDIKSMLPAGTMLNPALRQWAEKLPRFIRVGRSMLYPILDKLKELELFEKLAPASKLNSIARGNLVGMSLPENFNLEQAVSAVRKVEGLINKQISVDPTSKELTVASIISTAGRTRVMPLLGDKGSLQSMDFRSDDNDSLIQDADALRTLCLDTVGVPSELIYKSDGDSKGDVLKRSAKYVRKLHRIQKAIETGCKQIAYIHLANRGIKFKEEDVTVIFNNTLVEIDNLDKLEHAEVTTNLLATVRDFFNELAEEGSPFEGMVDFTKVVSYLNLNFKTVGLADVINTKLKPQEPNLKDTEVEDPEVEDPEVEDPEVEDPKPTPAKREPSKREPAETESDGAELEKETPKQ